MAGINDAHSRLSCCGDRSGTRIGDPVAIAYLRADAYLHIVDEQGGTRGIADLCDLQRKGHTVNGSHAMLQGVYRVEGVRSQGLATSTEASNRNSSGSGAS